MKRRNAWLSRFAKRGDAPEAASNKRTVSANNTPLVGTHYDGGEVADEFLEVTPKTLRLRKRILNSGERQKAKKSGKSS